MNIFKPHLLCLMDGKYAVRKFSLFYLNWVYFDFSTPYFWYPKDAYFQDYITYDLTKALVVLEDLKLSKAPHV
jgi:hypothetical protein